MISRRSNLPMPDGDASCLGQVFTPQAIVDCMLELVRNAGRVLEPACGEGIFLKHFPGGRGIEIDPHCAPPEAEVMNFFALPEDELFDTIIGNPPYVRHRDISSGTRCLASKSILDKRANLYLFFIEKCLRHLKPGGELIFITPRNLLKASSAVPLNQMLFASGTLTEFIDLGDLRPFGKVTPNCAIWRFERGDFSRHTRYAKLGYTDGLEALETPQWTSCRFSEKNGQILFSRNEYALQLSDIAFVKVGAVSGADRLYADEKAGNREFVCSSTLATGKTRRMIWCSPGEPPPEVLIPHKRQLIARRIRHFDETNWWHWGRSCFESKQPRIYVNCKTRHKNPFFVHDCPNYDGSVLAIFPYNSVTDIHALTDALNGTDWADLGFICDGRFLFTQRSLEKAPLPTIFHAFASLPDTG